MKGDEEELQAKKEKKKKKKEEALSKGEQSRKKKKKLVFGYEGSKSVQNLHRSRFRFPHIRGGEKFAAQHALCICLTYNFVPKLPTSFLNHCLPIREQTKRQQLIARGQLSPLCWPLLLLLLSLLLSHIEKCNRAKIGSLRRPAAKTMTEPATVLILLNSTQLKAHVRVQSQHCSSRISSVQFGSVARTPVLVLTFSGSLFLV